MIFIWGSRLYGKVDEVPGMFYVATKFGHLWYVPLIPLGSQIVLREHEEGWDGVPIPMSGKSVLVAWLRAGLIIAALWSAVGIIGALGTGSLFGAMFSGVVAAIAVGLFVLTKKWKSIVRCDVGRAKELAQQAGFDEQGLQLIEAHFLAMEAAGPLEPR